MKGKVKDKFEIVFISFDENEDEWREHFVEMPSLALPFSARDTKVQLLE